jgi:hypothetical protein
MVVPPFTVGDATPAAFSLGSFYGAGSCADMPHQPKNVRVAALFNLKGANRFR